MKETALIFILVFCLGLAMNAQERSGLRLFKKNNREYSTNYRSAAWGDIYKKGTNELANIIIAQDDNQFYTWSGYSGYYYEKAPILRAFTHDGKQVFSTEIEDKFVQFIHFNNQLYFVGQSETEDDQVNISIQAVSKTDGALKGVKKQLFTVEKIKRVPFVTNRLNYSISPDNSQLVISLLHSEASEKTKTPNRISLKVLDKSLSVHWKLDEYQLRESNAFHVLSMVTDNAGTVYLATQLFDDASSIDDGHSVVLFTIDEQGDRIRALELEYWGLTIVDFVMKIDRGRVLGVGLYNSTAHYSRIKGVLLLELDSYHNEYQRLYSEDFPLDIIGNFIEKKKVDELKEIGQAYLNDVLLGEDGSVTLVAQEGNRTPLYGRYPMTRLETIDDSSPEPHSYGNLLVTKLSSSGRLLFTKVIRNKLTTSFTQQRMGAYSVFNFNDETHLFYYKGRFPSRSNPIIKTRISDRGTVTSEKFLKSSGPGLFICPRFFQKSVKDNSLLMYAQMTSKFRYGKLQIK